MPDPDLEIRGRGGGGQSPKITFQPFTPQFGLKIRGEPGPPGHSPGSVTGNLDPTSFISASGFFHEQARSDRDKYVKIYWENILPSEILHTVVNHTYVLLTGHQRQTANYCCKLRAKNVIIDDTTFY